MNKQVRCKSSGGSLHARLRCCGFSAASAYEKLACDIKAAVLVSLAVLVAVFAQPARAAGVDAILFVPVSWVVAFVLFVASLVLSPRRSRLLLLHVANVIGYVAVAYFVYFSSEGFLLITLYPVVSTLFLLVFVLVQRNAAQYSKPGGQS